MADNISKFQIRFAQDGDHDSIYALLGGDKTGIPVTDPRHPLSTTDAILKASHDANSQSRCWLAICGDKAVGIVTTRDFGGGIFVDDDYRRRGIAGALVSARENFMTDTMGKNEALVPLRADNQASIDLHKKLGYEFDEESKRKLAENPAGDIILHMTKKLADTEPPAVSRYVAPPETAELPSTNKAGLLNKAGKVQGAADVALSLAEGHYGDAAVSTTQQVAMNETTWKAVAEAGKDIAAVSKVAGQFAKKIPVIGAVVTAGYVAYEVGSDTYQGEYGRAGSAFVAGAAEAGGNLAGLGVGDAAREGVRETIHHTAGEKYMPDESGLRSLSAKTMDMASKFFFKSAKEKPVEPPVPQHTANNKNSEMKL